MSARHPFQQDAHGRCFSGNLLVFPLNRAATVFISIYRAVADRCCSSRGKEANFFCYITQPAQKKKEVGFNLRWREQLYYDLRWREQLYYDKWAWMKKAISESSSKKEMCMKDRYYLDLSLRTKSLVGIFLLLSSACKELFRHYVYN